MDGKVIATLNMHESYPSLMLCNVKEVNSL